MADTPWDSWAPVYDLTDSDRAPFIEFYSGLVTASTRSVLELGCGTGTVLIPIAARLVEIHGARGTRIAGIDESEAMIGIARDRDPAIDWQIGDMRAPPISEEFDLIFCCFNTLQLLTRSADLSATFDAVRARLAEGGRFAFDLYRPNIPYISIDAVDRPTRIVRDQAGTKLRVLETTTYESDTAILQIDWRLVKDSDPAAAPLARTRYRMRQYFPSELEAMLEGAGLTIEDRFGDLDRSRFCADRSKRQVVVCTRA